MADRALSLLVKFAALDRLTGPMRSMLTGSRGLSRGIAQTRQELAGLRRSEASLAAFRGLETKLRGNAAQLEAARQKTAQLRSEIAATDAPTKKLAAALARAEREEKRLVDQHEAHGQKLQELSRKLEAAGMDVTELGRHEDRLAESIRDANRRLEEQKEQLERNERAQARVDRAFERGQRLRDAGYNMVGAGTAAAIPLVASGISAANFQTTMSDIAQKADITRARAAAIGREFDRMAPSVARLPEELAQGVDTLLGLGASLPQSMQAIRPIARAATAYHAEVADLANASYASIQNLNVAAGETGRALDIMATAGKAGAFELRDMATYFPQLTAGANALGMRGTAAVADLSAALQIARRGAGDSASAANNVQNLLNKINTRDTVQNFRAMGVDINRQLREGMRQGKSPIEIIAEQAQRATRGDLSKLSYLFGDAQVQAALRPLVQNLADYRRIRAQALNATGTVERDFNERMRDSAEVYRQNVARLTSLAHVVGGALLPTFNAFMGKVGALADRMSAWAERNPQLVAFLAKVAAIGAVLLIVLGGLSIAVGTVLGPFAYFGFILRGALPVLGMLATGIRFAATAFLWLGRALMLNPIGLAVTAIAAAAYLVYRYWNEIKGAFSIAFGWMARFGSWLGGWAYSIFRFLTWPIRAAGRLIVEAWAGIKAAFSQAMAFIQRVVQGGMNAIAYFFRPVILLLRGDFRGAANAAVDVARSMTFGILGSFERLFPGIGAAFAAGWARVRGAITSSFAWLGSLPSRFYQFGVAMIQGLLNGVTSRLAALRDRIMGVGQQISSWFRSTLGINSPSRVFMQYGGHLTEGLALGVQRGERAPIDRVLGMAGRLTAALAVGAASVPAAAGGPAGTASGAGGRGGNTYHFHIAQQPGQSSQDLARAIANEIDRRERSAAAAARSSYFDDGD